MDSFKQERVVSFRDYLIENTEPIIESVEEGDAIDTTNSADTWCMKEYGYDCNTKFKRVVADMLATFGCEKEVLELIRNYDYDEPSKDILKKLNVKAFWMINNMRLRINNISTIKVTNA